MAQGLVLIAIIFTQSPFLEPEGMLHTWDGDITIAA